MRVTDVRLADVVVGTRLRLARRAMGCSQQNMAALLEIRRASLVKMERGRMSIPVWLVAEMAIWSDKPLNWFFEDVVKK